jgi:hypothetical protein
MSEAQGLTSTEPAAGGVYKHRKVKSSRTQWLAELLIEDALPTAATPTTTSILVPSTQQDDSASPAFQLSQTFSPDPPHSGMPAPTNSCSICTRVIEEEEDQEYCSNVKCMKIMHKGCTTSTNGRLVCGSGCTPTAWESWILHCWCGSRDPHHAVKVCFPALIHIISSLKWLFMSWWISWCIS